MSDQNHHRSKAESASGLRVEASRGVGRMHQLARELALEISRGAEAKPWEFGIEVRGSSGLWLIYTEHPEALLGRAQEIAGVSR